mmetsp:Transcript_26177/g.84537  ORF Transcript_26177/g.84537 Transcript_26177/m.84537 type:complete len:211 (-) Transcript_26177:72-704(-)
MCSTATRLTWSCRSCVPKSWYDSARNWQLPSSAICSCWRLAKLSRWSNSLIPATISASRAGRWSELPVHSETLLPPYGPCSARFRRTSRDRRWITRRASSRRLNSSAFKKTSWKSSGASWPPIADAIRESSTAVIASASRTNDNRECLARESSSDNAVDKGALPVGFFRTCLTCPVFSRGARGVAGLRKRLSGDITLRKPGRATVGCKDC